MDPYNWGPSGCGSAWTDADPDLHLQMWIWIQEVKKY